jgi:hypothetical protein
LNKHCSAVAFEQTLRIFEEWKIITLIRIICNGNIFVISISTNYIMYNYLTNDKNKLTNLQLEFLKSLKYMATEKQLTEIKSLLRFYFSQQLDVAIEDAENKRGYTEQIYMEWLKNNADSDTKPGK